MNLIGFAIISLVTSKVYFKETFDGEWKKNWIQAKISGFAKFTGSPGWWFTDLSNKGLLTETPNANYAISSKFEEFDMTDKPLVIQYTLRNHQIIDCGGSYIKLLYSSSNPKKLNAHSPFLLMFGPDKCDDQESFRIVLPYNDRHYFLSNQNISLSNDTFTHQLTLAVYPDFSVKFLYDNEELYSGSLRTDFDVEDIKEDSYCIKGIAGIGIEIMQSTPGSMFDNILVCDSLEEAFEFSKETFSLLLDGEKYAFKRYTIKQELIREEYNDKVYGSTKREKVEIKLKRDEHEFF